MKHILLWSLVISLSACSSAGPPPHQLVRCPSGGNLIVVPDKTSEDDLESLLWHFVRCVDCPRVDRDEQGRWTGNLLFFRDIDRQWATCEQREQALSGRGWESYVGHVAASYSFWGASLASGQLATIGHPDSDDHTIIAKFGPIVDPETR